MTGDKIQQRPQGASSHQEAFIRSDMIKFIAVVIIAFAAGFAIYEIHVFYSNMIPGIYLKPIYAIIILISGYIWIRILTTLLEKVVEPTIGITKTHGIKNLLYIVAGVLLIAVIAALFNFGGYIYGILVGAGFAGIVLGLAAQQVLGNIFAGLSLLASRPFEIGDRITLVTASYGLMGGTYNRENQLNGFTGVVTDVGIFYTKVALDEGTPSVFPNSVVIASMAVNHSKVKLRRVRQRMDLDKQKIQFQEFRRRFIEAMKRHDDVVDPSQTNVEISDVGIPTYQVVMICWSRSAFDEPVKTIMIEEALAIQRELSA